LVNTDTVASVTLTCAGIDSAAAPGAYDISPSAATGTGLSNYDITYANGTLTVAKAIAIWDVTSSPTPSTRGHLVTLTATVTNTAATGTVTFKDGGVTISSATPENGTATFSTSTLSAGSHYITVSYAGDANFADSTSLAHVHRLKMQAGFPWWLILVIIAVAALAGLFFWFLFFRRRRKQEQPAQS
jgi:hypothetical protein